MRTLHRHLLREMIASIGVAVMVCTGLLLLGNLLKEILSLLMTGRATLWLVARGIGYLLPFVLAFALPMGALTAALLVFGRMSADQELTAARANGISLLSLAVPVMALSLALCGVCGWINLDLAPRCRVAYKELFTELAREHARTLIPPGRFVTEYPGFVIYADRVLGDDLEEVLFFQVKDGQRIRDVRAPRARLEFVEERRELSLTFFDARILEWVPRRPAPPIAEAGPSASEPAEAPQETPNDPTIIPADANPEPGMAEEARSLAEAEPAILAESGDARTDVASTSVDSGTNGAMAEAGDDKVTGSEPAPGLARQEAAGGETKVDGVEGDEEGWWLSITSGDARASVTLPPDVIRGGMPALSDMTWGQLWSERRELRRLGLDDLTPLEVQLHRQAAFSFATFGFVLVGIPLGVRAHRRETSVGVAVAIGLVLVYYAFLVTAQALETRAEAAPWMIVWMPNALFQLTGGWLLWRVNRGR